VGIATAKLKKYKSPGSDQIPAELYQAGGETLVSVMHKLITSIWNKEELPDIYIYIKFLNEFLKILDVILKYLYSPKS
jgi:hypothetical protein